MSVYIPGMEMPTSCFQCKMSSITTGQWAWCRLRGDCYPPDDSPPAVCPLVPVPEHGRQDGLYPKYFVIKTETGEIVQDCFVLRPQKDKAAVAALLLYAKETESPELSSDIRGWVSTIIPADKEGTEADP